MNHLLCASVVMLTVVAYLSCFYVLFGKRTWRVIGVKEAIPLVMVGVLYFVLVVFFSERYGLELLVEVLISLVVIPCVLDVGLGEFMSLFLLILPITGIVGSILSYVLFLVGIENEWYVEAITLAVTLIFLWGFYLIKGKSLDRDIFILPRYISVILSIFLYIIVGMFPFFTSFLKTKYRGGATPLISALLIIGGVIILGATLFLIYYINAKRKSDYEKTLAKVYSEQQREYFSRMLERETETKQYRHDEIAQLIQLQHYLEKNDLGKAKSFVNEMLQEITDISNEVFDVGNDIINTMLNYYLIPLKRRGYKIDVKGFMGPGVTISEKDLCIVVSNLIKNATEAVSDMGTEDGFVKVELKMGEVFWNFKVINSTINEGIEDTSKADKNNHGFGLKNVRRIVEKYTGSFDFCLDNQNVTVEVALPI
ncbi:MAG: GHKL domain-containing protein [Lachnospiraceae bacterium]|nr:GHKL domain-containing protein [Lachnospiraceae bacterium]